VQGVTQEPISHGAVLVNNSFVQEGGESFFNFFIVISSVMEQNTRQKNCSKILLEVI